MRALTLTLALLLIIAPAVAADSWESVSRSLYASVARVSVYTDPGVPAATCSAFSINEDRNYYLTAAHCAGEYLMLDNQIAWRIYFNDELDLMVVQAPGLTRLALEPSRRAVTQGTEIAAYGYAEGLPLPSLRTGVVQLANIQLDIWVGDPFTGRVVTGQRWHVSDYAYIGGMSGGPVVDRSGRIVSIVQLGSPTSGLGRPLDVILEATGQFWE